MERRAAALIFLLAANLGSAPAAPVPVFKPSALRDAEFEKLWNAIGWYQPDAVKFWCRVHADPKAGYAYLDRKIEPIQMSEATGKRLIDDLGSDDEPTWKAAVARLKARDIRLAMNFLDAWDYAKSDVQKVQLSAATFEFVLYPEYYNAKIELQRGALGQPPYHELNLTLKRDVPPYQARPSGEVDFCSSGRARRAAGETAGFPGS